MASIYQVTRRINIYSTTINEPHFNGRLHVPTFMKFGSIFFPISKTKQNKTKKNTKQNKTKQSKT